MSEQKKRGNNTPGFARGHYDNRKANRPFQLWFKAEGFRIAAAPKGEVGAVPFRSTLERS